MFIQSSLIFSGVNQPASPNLDGLRLAWKSNFKLMTNPSHLERKRCPVPLSPADIDPDFWYVPQSFPKVPSVWSFNWSGRLPVNWRTSEPFIFIQCPSLTLFLLRTHPDHYWGANLLFNVTLGLLLLGSYCLKKTKLGMYGRKKNRLTRQRRSSFHFIARMYPLKLTQCV